MSYDCRMDTEALLRPGNAPTVCQTSAFPTAEHISRKFGAANDAIGVVPLVSTWAGIVLTILGTAVLHHVTLIPHAAPCSSGCSTVSSTNDPTLRHTYVERPGYLKTSMLYFLERSFPGCGALAQP